MKKFLRVWLWKYWPFVWKNRYEEMELLYINTRFELAQMKVNKDYHFAAMRSANEYLARLASGTLPKPHLEAQQ